jgi:hypothetical protein
LDQALVRKAQEWTADELRRLRLHGWLTVNHVVLEQGSVDHALLGPGGFFAIENTLRSDWSNDKRDLSSIIRSTQTAAWDLGVRMRLRAVRVQPLLVLWGPDVHTHFPEIREEDGVTFLRGDQLRDHIRSLPSEVRDDEVQSAFAYLDDYLPWRDAISTAS